ncbi:Hypothetical_protein [Hexamita inflata]|uniref:Hypothetical_protein n=1 Tax=Hexamita inflata TaxID=28002 RepID=A0AA86UVI3_9EUKA|nr:Hypothetical protein HINF_LOCUS53956 [Hexamita inflata]
MLTLETDNHQNTTEPYYHDNEILDCIQQLETYKYIFKQYDCTLLVYTIHIVTKPQFVTYFMSENGITAKFPEFLQIYIVTLIFRQSKYKSQVILTSITCSVSRHSVPSALVFHGRKNYVLVQNLYAITTFDVVNRHKHIFNNSVAKASLWQRATCNSRNMCCVFAQRSVVRFETAFVSQFTVRSSRTFKDQ